LTGTSGTVQGVDWWIVDCGGVL